MVFVRHGMAMALHSLALTEKPQRFNDLQAAEGILTLKTMSSTHHVDRRVASLCRQLSVCPSLSIKTLSHYDRGIEPLFPTNFF